MEIAFAVFFLFMMFICLLACGDTPMPRTPPPEEKP